MTDLASVLTAPSKKKAASDPNVTVLRRFMRQGWAKGRPRGREVFVRQYGDEVWMTDTYGMRRWHRDAPEAVALLSMIPEGSGVDASEGFALVLGMTPMFAGGSAPDMAAVMPLTVVGRLLVTDWRTEKDGEWVVGIVDGGDAEVVLDRKRLAMVTDRAEDVRAWCDPERPDCRPVAFSSVDRADSEPFAILMPLRK